MPCFSYYLMIYIIIFFVSFFQLSIAGNNETDRLALLEIKAKINDPFGALDSWNDSLHFCSWYGVTCGLKHQRVRAIELPSLKLSGSISPYIGNLSFLTDLRLHNNSIGGILPPEIGRLHRLQLLALFNNSFTGEIPSNISGCHSLIKLHVYNNKWVGSIPNALGSLLNLQLISLSINNLTGNIPSSLGNLSSLSILDLGKNKFVGNIPNSLGRLRNLTGLGLCGNMLSGLVPSSIFNLSRLETLDIGVNNLHGSLPSYIGVTLPLLNWFSISENSFTGIIPTSVSNLSNLALLQLNSNHLIGKVPSLKNLVNLRKLHLGINYFRDDLGFISSLENATKLYIFEISQNNFSGILPRIICNLSSISYLHLDINMISGEIPVCIEKLTNLQAFSIMGNLISGVIPNEIGKLQNLNQLSLAHNQLSGYIPSSVGNLTNLGTVDFSWNNLVGQIPSSVGNCLNLLYIDLSRNNLSGSIPPEILSVSNLAIGLYLNDNSFTGPLHKEVGQLRNLIGLDISSNMLSGEIPTTLTSCVMLLSLDMGGNFFEGNIPNGMKTLMSLQMLDLSPNNLSGEIPKFLVNLPLVYLNLSYNNFDGEIPVGGVFDNATGILIVGNAKLCGGISLLKLPKCPPHIKRGRHKNKLLLALVFGFLGIILLVAVALLGYFWYRKMSKNTTNADDSKGFFSLSYQNLLKATNGFSVENLIGSGAFGVVYKGFLYPEEPPVAIKVFKLENHGASKSFMAECGVLRNIKHRNLVKVITVCSSIDYQGNDFKALVYEYMVNNSLEEWLHPAIPHQRLKFRQRLDIAVDVAFAMEYLHHGCGEVIVHCDLKPSNILLDQDMVAHVGDFGLAKFLATSQTFQSTSLGVRGTVGYTPPEYGLGNEISTSGDVYSFGILLMEMVTGKRPTLDMFKGGLTLHKLVEAALPEEVSKIIDDALFEDGVDVNTENRRGTLEESSSLVLGLALSCCSELPCDRLNMKEVASEISSIRNRFIKDRR